MSWLNKLFGHPNPRVKEEARQLATIAPYIGKLPDNLRRDFQHRAQALQTLAETTAGISEQARDAAHVDMLRRHGT